MGYGQVYEIAYVNNVPVDNITPCDIILDVKVMYRKICTR